ncbi:MAG TPA: GspH/FimT family pseudopilin [Candidatus Competibacteraceae bacterium]|nr:GspH/FimT family pseudopilin [Candidatus Competibacteraceae bacterium]
MPKCRNTTQGGFTLIELMIVIVISAIILAWGVPSFETFIKNNRVTAETNRFLADIQLARSEAIKRGVPVNICRVKAESFNPNSPACHTGTSERQYELGWVAYTSTARDTSITSSNTQLAIGSAVASGITIRSDGAGNGWLSFQSNGMLNEGAGVSARYRICAKASSSDSVGANTEQVPGREITISPTGRPSISKLPAGTACSF